jgi:hypothetical protein
MMRTEFIWLRIVNTSWLLRTCEIIYLAINENENIHVMNSQILCFENISASYWYI